MGDNEADLRTAGSKDDLFSNFDLDAENIDVRELKVPDRIKKQWVSVHTRAGGRDISYPILRGNLSEDFVMDTGDIFNAILMRYSNSGVDRRIFQFMNDGYIGYSKNYEIGISNTDTLPQRHMRTGLVYRFETVCFKKGENATTFFARPLWLIIGDGSTKVNYQKFELHEGDEFFLKVNGYNKKGRPHGKFLRFSCRVDNANKKINYLENLYVKAERVRESVTSVSLVRRDIPNEEYEKYKKRVFS